VFPPPANKYDTRHSSRVHHTSIQSRQRSAFHSFSWLKSMLLSLKAFFRSSIVAASE